LRSISVPPLRLASVSKAYSTSGRSSSQKSIITAHGSVEWYRLRGFVAVQYHESGEYRRVESGGSIALYVDGGSATFLDEVTRGFVV
jgi:hypothetical protein